MKRVLALVCLVGCTTTSPPPAPPVAADLDVPAVPPSARAEPQPVGEPRARHPAGEVMVDDGAAMPAIGGPCRDAKTCGKSGKLSVARKAFHGQRPPPEPPCKLVGTTDPKRSMGNAAMACVDAGRVYVANVCMFCRITSEERLVGAIDDMTPEQLAGAQELAGLPAEPLLGTADAWSSAIAAAARSHR